MNEDSGGTRQVKARQYSDQRKVTRSKRWMAGIYRLRVT